MTRLTAGMAMLVVLWAMSPLVVTSQEPPVPGPRAPAAQAHDPAPAPPPIDTRREELVAAPDPYVREDAAEKVSDHVYVIPDGDRRFVPNIGIVVGTRGTLVIDTGLGTANGEIVLAEARKISHGGDLYLATTNVDPEHALGAAAFSAAKIIRSEDQEREIADAGYRAASLVETISSATAELLDGSDFRKADITFAADYTLDLGGVTVRAFAAGTNHSRGDTIYLVSPDSIMFTGDVVMGPPPAAESPGSSLRGWLATLDRFEKMDPQRLVPGHGPQGDQIMFGDYRLFLQTIGRKVAELKKQGKNVEEIVDLLAAEQQAVDPDGRRVATLVRAAFRETP